MKQKKYPMKTQTKRIKIKRGSKEGINIIKILKLFCEKFKKLLSEQYSIKIFFEQI